MKISKETLSALVHGEDDIPEWKILDNSVIDEWRWGTVSQIALEHVPTGERYGYRYKKQIGNHYYNYLDEEVPDGSEVDVYPVETVMVASYRQVRK